MHGAQPHKTHSQTPDLNFKLEEELGMYNMMVLRRLKWDQTGIFYVPYTCKVFFSGSLVALLIYIYELVIVVYF